MSKVVFITGASSGIGKAIGEFLHAKSFKVYGTSRNPNNVQQPTSFSLIEMEVTDSVSVQKAIQKVIENEGRLDVVINNAGVGITGPLEETPKEEILRAYDINVIGPMEVCKNVIPHMRKQGSGLIINVTSIAGYMGLPYRGVYSATKASLEVLTEAYRMEVAQFGIKMTNVAPGDFATNIAAGRYHCPVIKGSPYEEVYGQTLETMNEHVDQGDNPMVMATEVYAIIQSNNPKVHYRVGSFLQRFSVYLKKWLPDRLYEKMLKRHYDI